MNYRNSKGCLLLFPTLVAVLLQVACAPSAPSTPTPPPLAGTQWVLVSLGPTGAEKPVLPAAKLTLVFQEGKRHSGSAGCNNYSDGYTVDGSKITVGPLASTRMVCADVEFTNQETNYLAALQKADSHKMDQAAGTLNISYDGVKARCSMCEVDGNSIFTDKAITAR